jgi:hypothetical protein
MKHLLCSLCCALLLPALSPLTGRGDDFEQRRTRLLQVAAAEQEYSLITILAKLQTRTDLDKAYVMLDSMAHDRAVGGMFFAYSMMGVYLHARDVLPDSLRTKIREAFRVRTMYRGDTENHWVMYYTGMYLAAQTWPGEPGTAWFNGKSSDENLTEAAGWLQQWMRTTVTIGQGEFDSPTYMIVFLCPMLLLQEFAAEPVMKTKAGMMVDLLLADFAAEHLNGNFGGGHSRDYPDDIVNPLSSPSTMWAWLYFGQPAMEQWKEARYRPRHRGSWETVFAAASSYRMPEIIRHIATDRVKPYVHREKKRVRNIIRSSAVKNPPVYKYTYMSPRYVIGSIQGGILQPIQQHTWDVTFSSTRTHNTLFSLHPFASGKELAMFFPEEQKFLAGEVDRYHLVYTNPGKWNSSSPYEQTFQYRNDLIVLYDIADSVRHPHADGFFPKTLDERIVDPTGWIFARWDSVYVGVFPLSGAEWTGDSICWRWRSTSRRTGWVVEVRSFEESGPFDAFQRSLRSRIPDASTFARTGHVRFTTAGGDRMAFGLNGSRVVNGRPVSFKDYPLYEGPWMRARAGEGVITLTDGVRTHVLDFNKAEVRER